MRIAILDLVQVRVGIMLRCAFTFHITHYTNPPFVSWNLQFLGWALALPCSSLPSWRSGLSRYVYIRVLES